MTFGQVADLGWPVVHFGVDVDGIFAAPGRNHRFIPDSLKICRLASCTTAGSEYIPAELKAERFKVGIVLAIAHRFQPLVDWLLVHGAIADVQMHAAHQRLKVIDMPL